ncbi:PREDICTED: cyclic nucleotide-gated ion channel 1-like [Fragaria vesca subsp. vesca]|uniref:cyclic nucleotide-gated ion channel 1-like n=1 Tax=Fragaria vesca subsp. vesca TaxID=101020 RepID=UPI0002C2E97E|nr:PREDICTED: cyclic nucleotide-gated ion channel 1-like [Fragaria vesca subsp. vesca]XP_011469066.1 PREDICTED: cyclic nucleotide-gated ion channel 1-like [Fragaria vesca subsp. vesca]
MEQANDIEQGDGGHKSTITTKELEETLKKHNEPRNRWNAIFTISCAIAIFIDPLYCYAPVIHGKCLELHQRLMWTYIGLRLAVDVFYAIDLGKWWSRSKKTKVLYLILVSLPLPEGLLLSSICSELLLYTWDPTYALIITTPIQYSLRIYHMYVSLRRRRPIFKSGMGKWLTAVMDYLPFVLASHLFGALWYRLAVQRQIDCWKSHCEKLLLPVTKQCKSISSRDFFCKTMSSLNTSDISIWDKLCHPVKEANPEAFDFGIYLHALQSNVTSSTHAVKRISQSFWWALRNLSSFGSNLQTSLYTMEIFLSVLISISGMALFLVYLNARVQESQKILMESKSKKKTQLLKPDIDLWLYKNNIRFQKDNIQEDEDLKRLKKAIMENIHKLGENNDIDLQNMLSILPVNDKKRIIRLLCLDSLKKVPILENIRENVLIAICQHLKPVTYTEDNYIVQEGRPLGKMIFIMQGLAWTYTASNIIGETLKRGDFYGEEVLTWAFQSLSFSGLPISTRSVMSQGKIEAFAIKADHLKSVVYKFWWHFRKEVGVSQLELWEHLAASSIQAAWRLRNAKSKPLSKWYKIPYP